MTDHFSAVFGAIDEKTLAQLARWATPFVCFMHCVRSSLWWLGKTK